MLLLAASLQSRAQFGMGKIEEIEAVQGRKLIVMIEEPREKMLKRIEKKPKRGSVDDYKADLKLYNENIKAVIEKFWPYNKTGIQYMTYDEIEALRKTKTKDYAVVACLSSEARSTSAGYKYAEGLYWVKDIKEDFEDRDDDMFSVMLVNTIEDFSKKPVYFVPLFDVFPTKAALAYGLMNVKNYFNLRIQTKKNGAKMRDEQERAEEEMAKRAPTLAQKTLLIREEWLDKELTKDNLKNVYPYPYKVCDREFMDNVVMNQDASYAYGVELPYVMSTSHSNSVMYIQYVMDGADSQPMCLVKPSTGGMMLASGITGKAGTRNFTMKTMMKIVEQAKGKRK
jgi:hypothetical protein